MTEKICLVTDTKSRIRRVLARVSMAGTELWLDFAHNDAAALHDLNAAVDTLKAKDAALDENKEWELKAKVYPEVDIKTHKRANRGVVTLSCAHAMRGIKKTLWHLKEAGLTTDDARDRVVAELEKILGPSEEQGARVNDKGEMYWVLGAQTGERGGGGRGA